MSYDVKVQAFGRLMTQRFEANADRGGYRTRDPEKILPYLKEMREQLAVLEAALKYGQHEPGTIAPEHVRTIGDNCADIANLALIVAENCNAIEYTDREMGIMG